MNQFEQQLRDNLKASRKQPEPHQPDFEALAALVDDALPPGEQEKLLAHLAGCQLCSGLAVSLVESTRPAARRSWGQWFNGWRQHIGLPVLALAGAAAALMLSVTLVQRSTQPTDWFAEAPELGIAATWDQPNSPVYRNAGESLAAVPLSPRRSLTASLRPEMRWRGIADDAQRLEILVIDDAQNLVARWQPQAVMQHSQWPEPLDSLQAGQVYAWKISYWTPLGPQTTAFTPFKVTAEALPVELQGSATKLAALIRNGQFDLAWQVLADPDQLEESIVDELRTTLAERLHFSQAEIALLTEL
jgi:hypothetical protein